MTDKFNQILQQLIAEKKPGSIEELQKILDSFIGKTPEDLQFKAETNADKALELVWEAWELPTDKGRRLAQKALKLNPDCIEAYEYMGNSYSYYHKQAPFFEKAVEIGRRIFGGDYMKQQKGHFWMLTETRPFMRSLSALAECHYSLLQTEPAILIWKEMLELNPNDNQGIRYNLSPALLEKKDLAAFKKLRTVFKGDNSTMMKYNDALAVYIEHGKTDGASALLRSAFTSNKFVPPLLLQTYPPTEHPESYGWHTKEEALMYVHSAWRAWSDWNTPGAKDWLQREWWLQGNRDV